MKAQTPLFRQMKLYTVNMEAKYQEWHFASMFTLHFSRTLLENNLHMIWLDNWMQLTQTVVHSISMRIICFVLSCFISDWLNKSMGHGDLYQVRFLWCTGMRQILYILFIWNKNLCMSRSYPQKLCPLTEHLRMLQLADKHQWLRQNIRSHKWPSNIKTSFSQTMSL